MKPSKILAALLLATGIALAAPPPTVIPLTDPVEVEAATGKCHEKAVADATLVAVLSSRLDDAKAAAATSAACEQKVLLGIAATHGTKGTVARVAIQKDKDRTVVAVTLTVE